MQVSENNISEDDVIQFVRSKTNDPQIEWDTDIFASGCTGNKFSELVLSFGRRFNVDTSSYLWYFHTNEETLNIGAVFFKPPYERVERIPLTPAMLYQFALSGSWNIFYPEHEIPSSRIDHLLNILIIFAIAFLLIYVASKKY